MHFRPHIRFLNTATVRLIATFPPPLFTYAKISLTTLPYTSVSRSRASWPLPEAEVARRLELVPTRRADQFEEIECRDS